MFSLRPNIEKMRKRGDVEGLIKALGYLGDATIIDGAAKHLCDLGGERVTEALIQHAKCATYGVEDTVIEYFDRVGDGRVIPQLAGRLIREIELCRIFIHYSDAHAVKLTDTIRHIIERLPPAEATKVVERIIADLNYSVEEESKKVPNGITRSVWPIRNHVSYSVVEYNLQAFFDAMNEVKKLFYRMQEAITELEPSRVYKFVPLCIDCNVRMAKPDGEIWSTTPIGSISCPNCGEQYMFKVSGVKLVLTRTTVPVGRQVQRERTFERLPG